MKAVVIVVCVIVFFALYILLRAFVVYNERTRWVKETSRVTGSMMHQGKENWMEPWNRYDKALSYNQMVWQLFRFHWELDLSDLERGD